MLFHVVLIALVHGLAIHSSLATSEFYDYLKCQVCETKKMDGQVSDCSCGYETVDDAVGNFYIPLLQNLTSRYFRVDLEKPCPFWNDEGGMCTNEGCSICPCDEGEIPKAWLQEQHAEIGTGGEGESREDEYGWISRAGIKHSQEGGVTNSGRLGKVTEDSGASHIDHHQKLSKEDADAQKWEDRWEWTEMTENGHYSSTSMYVNLVKNPERFTGYSGPSARLVWKAIQEENCFGGDGDVCLEKRIFHRLISGLQSSISTQIARDYYYPPADGDFSGKGRWGPNIPMFVKAVGAHPSRLSNLYFAFLFVSRAVAKAGDILSSYDYAIGDDAEGAAVEELVKQLVNVPDFGQSGSIVSRDTIIAARQCKTGFDESSLFQVHEAGDSNSNFWETKSPSDLREEFRYRFRNISRIMDCVSCEKCRVWGKLEMLGLGTAIKILLTPEEEFAQIPIKKFLSRQEIIALINTLNQLAKSIHFATRASELEFGEKLSQIQNSVVSYTAIPLATIGIVALLFYLVKLRGGNSNTTTKSTGAKKE